MLKNNAVSSSHPQNSCHFHYDGSNTIKAAVSSSLGQTQVSQIPIICLNASHIKRSSNIWFAEDPLQFPFHLILMNAVLVIIITRLVRFLLKPLKQPRVVSEIIGGIIMGPSGFGRSKKFCDYLLPTNVEFVIRNLGVMGFMLFLFITAVKMDISMVQKATKKHWLVALLGTATPFFTVIVVSHVIRSSFDEQLAKSSSIIGIAASMAVTGYFVLHPVLQELNLISSEIGRMALSSAIIVDLIGIILLVAFEALFLAEVNPNAVRWYMISTITFACFNFILLRRGMMLIVERTPQGKPVKQTYVTLLLVGMFFMGFLADLLGIGVGNGPMWFGLAIPDGPPLGSALVEKSETLMNELFMPFSFVFIGMLVDVSSMINATWSSLAPLFIIMLTGYITKMLSTLGASLLIEMPHKDGLALSFIMSLRGQLEFILAMHWMDKRMMQIPSFTMVVLLTAAVTATLTPFITSLYDPTMPYRINKRRTIQHTQLSTELVVVACMPDRDGVASLINLLECSYPSSKCPYSVYSLQLIELIGRAAPIFIDHEKVENHSKHPEYELVHNALKLFQQSNSEFMKLHAFTVVAPKRTMYQDICELALANEAALIILPFHKEWLDPENDETIKYNRHLSVISKVLDHAPCSVGILVNKEQFQSHLSANKNRIQNFIVLFMGGADAREALAYADRIAKNPEVFLTIVRFLPQNHGEEDLFEKKLDDGAMLWFQERNEKYKRVAYKKVVVNNGEETLEAIQRLNEKQYDLWIMGRKQGVNPILVQGLTNSCEYHELGVIGDFVSSSDFNCSTSVLVVQQQVLRSERIKSRV